MGAFSESMKSTAENLIVQYGSGITLIQAVPTAMVETGTGRPYWMIEGVKSYVATSSLRYSGYATQRSVKSYEALDGRIRTTDLVFTIVLTPEPTTRDMIEWMGDKYTILHIDSSYVQGDAIVYKTFVRRA